MSGVPALGAFTQGTNPNQWVKEKRKRKRNLKTTENGNKIYQNLRDAAKEVPTGKFIVINIFIRKKESSQTI